MFKNVSPQGKNQNQHNYLGFLTFLGILMLWPILYPNPYYLNVMIFTGINVIVVTGLNLLLGYAGQISLAQASFFGMGAYCSAFCTLKLSWNPWAGLLVGIVITSIFSLLIGLPSLKLKGHYLAMATLGFNVIVEILIIQLVPITGGPDGLGGIPPFSIFGLEFNSDFRYYYLVWVMAGLSILLVINLVNSKVGRGMRALSESELASRVLGIDTFRYKLKIFVFTASYASIGGSLFAHYITHITPDSFGIIPSIMFLVMVILGGMGKIWGPLFGAGIMTILPEVLRAFKNYHLIAYGFIIIVIMMYFKNGVVGILNSVLERIPFFKERLIS